MDTLLNPKTQGQRWLAAALVVLCVVLSWQGTIDRKTGEYVDKAFEQALLAYAGARALNAGISLLQSAEIGAGVGLNASIQPFQVLDPVDDMVEDYATAMEYAIGSLVIQKLLVESLSSDFFRWLVLAAGGMLLVSLFFNGLYAAPVFKGFLFVTLIRFLFVMTVLLSGLMDNAFVNSRTEAEIDQVNLSVQALEQVESGVTDPQGSQSASEPFLTRMKARLSALQNLANTDHLKRKMDEAIKAMLTLTALFIFKTLIMPLLFLLLLLRSFSKIWGFDLQRLVSGQTRLKGSAP